MIDGKELPEMEPNPKKMAVVNVSVLILVFTIALYFPVPVKASGNIVVTQEADRVAIENAMGNSIEIVDITGTLWDLDWQSDWIDVENTLGQPYNPVGVSLITMNGTNPIWEGWRNGGEGEVAPYVSGTLTEAYFNLGVALHTNSEYTYAETMHTKLNNPLTVTVGPKETTGLPNPYRRNVTITEISGINRVLEPVDVKLTFADGDCLNATKQIRVNTTDMEIPSQVYNITTYSSGYVKAANVVFQANVTAYSSSNYYIYYGNLTAEAPNYPADLAHTGNGTITVENAHYKVTTTTTSAWITSLRSKDYDQTRELLKTTGYLLLGLITEIGGTWRGPWNNEFDIITQVKRSGPVFIDVRSVFENWTATGVEKGVANFRFYSRISYFTYSLNLTLDNSNFGHLLISSYFSLSTLPYAAYKSKWQNVYLKNVADYEDTGNAVIFNCTPSSGSLTPIVKISFSSPSVFRLQMSPNGTIPPGNGSAVYFLTDASGYVTLTTSNLTLKIRKNPWRLSVYDATGTNMISEESPNQAFENKSLSYRIYEDTVKEVREAMLLDPSEHFFGFGERFNKMDKRGMTTHMQVKDAWASTGDDTYLPVPFFISTKGYGIYLNSTYKSTFDMGASKSTEYSITVPASSLDYYFIYGLGDLKQIIKDYTDLTGKPPLPQEWVFHPWMSKNSYNTQGEVTYVINKTRELDIPGSVIVIEGGGGWWGWYSPSWPNPEWMISYAHSQGVRVIIWETPVIPGLGSTDYYNYARDQGYFVKNADGSVYHIPSGYWWAGHAILDFTNPAAVTWWLGLHDFLMDQGVDGFKTDGGEHVHDDTVVFYDGRRGAEMENLYAFLWVKTMHEYVMAKKGGDGITWSRSGFAGSQRYPCTWAGDQTNDFQHLQAVIKAGQSAGISGIPYWASDIGGYAGHPSDNLYIRWAQFGAFSPLMQYHGYGDHDPWTFNQETQDIYKFYATLRMNLMPYIYSYAKIANETGLPMMRALLLNYPDDPTTYSIEYEYTLGDELLVAPVYQDVTSRSIYLPDDTWIDFWDSSQIVGPTTMSRYSAPLYKIPLFIRAGAIIPMNLNENYTVGGSITNFSQLVFDIYPSNTSQFSYYDDENTAKRLIKCTKENDQTHIQVSAWNKNYTLRVLVDNWPTSVSQDGKNLAQYGDFNAFKISSEGWWYDDSSHRVFIKLQQRGEATQVTLRTMLARFAPSTLYALNLYINETITYGNNLTVKFYTYSGTYQGETTVWSGTTPDHVELNMNVLHPLGLPIEIAALVLTYENGTKILTITTFLMSRYHLIERLAKLNRDWIFMPAERPAIFREIVDIDMQWPYAPP